MLSNLFYRRVTSPGIHTVIEKRESSLNLLGTERARLGAVSTQGV